MRSTFAMSDNSYSNTFGPSTPGALNLISGNTSGATLVPLRPNGTAASPNGKYIRRPPRPVQSWAILRRGSTIA